MLYLFLGTDIFTKRERLRILATETKAQITHIYPEDTLPHMDELSEATLFGGSRLVIIHGGLARLDREAHAPRLSRSPHAIILWEDKLDKRKTANAEWLKDKHVIVEKFDPPSAATIPQWIVKRVKVLGGSIDSATAQYMAQRVAPEPPAGTFGGDPVDMWRLDNELRKVCTYAGEQSITKQTVDLVITDYSSSVESWDITNALADKNQVKAFTALEQFFAVRDSVDDKAKTIQLNAALAEQFRTILLVQDMQTQRIPDDVILSRTGWKSGRLFVLKKLAGRFEPKRVIDTLEKLHQLDKELKSSSTPGQVVLSLIAAQI